MKNLEEYIKCLKKRMLRLQGIIKKDNVKEQFKVDIDTFNHWQGITEFNTMKIVFDDLNEIIVHKKEQEREENNSVESFWKDWN